MAETVSGVFKLIKNGFGVLRDPHYSFRRQPEEIMVSAALIREHGLVPGATITGTARRGKKGRRSRIDATSTLLVPLGCGVDLDHWSLLAPARLLPLREREPFA